MVVSQMKDARALKHIERMLAPDDRMGTDNKLRVWQCRFQYEGLISLYHTAEWPRKDLSELSPEQRNFSDIALLDEATWGGDYYSLFYYADGHIYPRIRRLLLKMGAMGHVRLLDELYRTLGGPEGYPGSRDEAIEVLNDLSKVTLQKLHDLQAEWEKLPSLQLVAVEWDWRRQMEARNEGREPVNALCEGGLKPVESFLLPARPVSKIMYIEQMTGDPIEPAIIARVHFSRDGLTLYYDCQGMQRLKGEEDAAGANYLGAYFGDKYMIVEATPDGSEMPFEKWGVVEVDKEVRKEYWREVRQMPHAVRRERV